MKLQKITVLFLALGLSLHVFAQRDWGAEADRAFKNEKYFTAVDLYRSAIAKAKSKEDKARMTYNIAESYRYMLNNKQAEAYYRKAIKVGYAEKEPRVYLYLANAHMKQQQYDLAMEQYQKYNEVVPGNPEGELGIESCKKAQEWIGDPSRHQVNIEAQLNTQQYDFGANYADLEYKSIIFTSSREASTGKNVDERTGEGFQDLFIASVDENGRWSEPLPMSDKINSSANEGAASFNKDKTRVYFTRCPIKKRKRPGCDIYYSDKKGEEWGDAEKIELRPKRDGADTITFGHPAVSPDDEFIVFASDMPGGQGGRDLWVMTYSKGNNSFGRPKNLGTQINTSGDEITPFVDIKGDLYFASNGHVGMGGYDIFKAENSGKMRWANPENMKYPLNSAADDFCIVFKGDEPRGFFSSNRAGNTQDDIYNFVLPDLLFELLIAVINRETESPIEAVDIKIIGSDNSSYEAKTGSNGGYIFDIINDERAIKPNTTYSLEIGKEKEFLTVTDEISTIGLEENTTFVKEYFLDPVDKPIVLPEVRYAFNKHELQMIEGEVNSKDSLNVLYETLIDNPTIIIELRSHTDSRGDSRYNLRLSRKRARACINYLIEKGIDPVRLKARGMGEDELKISDRQIRKMKSDEEKEAAHQANRRTDFKVLNFDYVPKDKPVKKEEPKNEEEEETEEEDGEQLEEDN